MNAIFRVGMITGCLLTAMAGAQQEAKWAGLRIVNALGRGPEVLRVQINGKPWNEQGLETGEVSSLRRLKPGPCLLRFSGGGLRPHELRLTLRQGQSVSLLSHVKKAEEGQDAIAVLKLVGIDVGSGRVMTVVDLGMGQRRLLKIKQLGESWKTLALRRLQTQQFSLVQHRGYLPMKVGGSELESMPVFEHGHHVMVLYDGADGLVSSLWYRDRSWPVDMAQEP